MLTETWQLKIVSATVGTGEIRVTSNLYGGGMDPYLEISDPDSTNNTVALGVDIDTSTGGSGNGTPTPGTSTATPRPGSTTAAPQTGGTSSAGTGGRLPTTGDNVALIGGIGLAALAAGTALLVLTRRRRTDTTEER